MNGHTRALPNYCTIYTFTLTQGYHLKIPCLAKHLPYREDNFMDIRDSRLQKLDHQRLQTQKPIGHGI